MDRIANTSYAGAMPQHCQNTVALDRIDSRHKITITSNKNCSLYLTRGGELDHVDTQQNIDAFLMKNEIRRHTSALQLSKSHLES